MKALTTSLMIAAALTLGACSIPDRFGAGSGTGLGVDGFGGAGAIVPGSVNDPTSAAYFQANVGDRVLFPVDQSALTDVARNTLEGQAQWLLANTDYTVIIEGHADEQGTREYNLGLGARRANSVQEYLVDRGVSPARIRVVSFGKERPIELCSVEACYAQNRRAVTVVSTGLGS